MVSNQMANAEDRARESSPSRSYAPLHRVSNHVKRASKRLSEMNDETPFDGISSRLQDPTHRRPTFHELETEMHTAITAHDIRATYIFQGFWLIPRCQSYLRN